MLSRISFSERGLAQPKRLHHTQAGLDAVFCCACSGCSYSHAVLTLLTWLLATSFWVPVVLQECIGGNTTFTNNMASAGGSIAYIVDAAAAGLFSTTPTNNTRGPSFHRSIPTAVQEGSLQCTRLNLNRTGSTLGVAGPPCALVLWSPAAGTMLPYVNNGSGLPTINATVVDCWCSTIQQLPGEPGHVTYGSAAAIAQIALSRVDRCDIHFPSRGARKTPQDCSEDKMFHVLCDLCG